uniref:Uncharacterized protein n=1 Tax=Zea mays TaxID=4577 RepID=A0A804M746_MAIZE
MRSFSCAAIGTRRRGNTVLHHAPCASSSFNQGGAWKRMWPQSRPQSRYRGGNWTCGWPRSSGCSFPRAGPRCLPRPWTSSTPSASACCHCVCPYISLCLLQIVPSVLFVYSLLRIVLTTATERHFSQSRVSIFDYLLKAIFPFRLM